MSSYGAAVAASIAVAVVAAIEAKVPRDAPSYALESAVVYKGEVGLVVFLGLYLLVTAVFLANQDRTLGKVSTTGFELPPDLTAPVEEHQVALTRLAEAERRGIERDAELADQITELEATIAELRRAE